MEIFTNTIRVMTLACFTACAVGGNAANYKPVGPKVLQDGVYYQYVDDIDNNKYTVWAVGYDDATLPADLVLKEKLNIQTDVNDPEDKSWMEVTGIADSAFMASSTLTTIEIPKTIETIGDRAFAECEILSTVNIGNINIDTQIKLATMGAYLFENCQGDIFKGLTINFYRFMPAITDNDAFSNVWTTITMNVRNGSKMIWETQTATQGVTLTEDIENIEDMFFVFELNPDGQSYNVKAATTDLPNEVVIPVYKYDNPDIFVTEIAPRGFENCKHLKTLMIPPSLKTIGNLATIGCDSLYSIRLDDFGSSWMSADYLATKDGSVYSKDMTKLVLKPNAKTFSIPAGVTELCDFSVPLSKSNTRITIPTGVKK